MWPTQRLDYSQFILYCLHTHIIFCNAVSRPTIRLCSLFKIRHVIGCINHDIVVVPCSEQYNKYKVWVTLRPTCSHAFLLCALHGKIFYWFKLLGSQLGQICVLTFLHLQKDSPSIFDEFLNLQAGEIRLQLNKKQLT